MIDVRAGRILFAVLVVAAFVFFFYEAAIGAAGPALWWLINGSADIATVAELGVLAFLILLAVTAWLFQRDADRRSGRR